MVKLGEVLLGSNEHEVPGQLEQFLVRATVLVRIPERPDLQNIVNNYLQSL